MIALASLLLLAAARGAGTDAAALEGVWKVDLRPTPDAADYYQEMTISDVAEGTCAATFYGTEARECRINADWGAVRFAFVTRDGSGAYNHQGVLAADGTISGTTHSIGRDFLSVWTAARAD